MVESHSRVDEELELLRRNFPELEYLANGNWVRLPRCVLPDALWDPEVVEVCFQIPEKIPGQAPYGFYVRPGLAAQSGQTISNYVYPAPTAFGADWGKFSWQLEGWAPAADLIAGTNMLNFARSIADRFAQGA